MKSCVPFAKLCQEDGTPRFAIDSGVVVKRKTVTDAVGLVDKNIEERLFSIQDKSGCIVKHIYIGKSFIEKRASDFDPEQPSTWKLGGIHSRYKEHKENDYIACLMITASLYVPV